MCFIPLTQLKVEEVRALNNTRYVFQFLLPQEIILNGTVFRNLTLPLNDAKFTFWFTMFLWIVLPGCFFLMTETRLLLDQDKLLCGSSIYTAGFYTAQNPNLFNRSTRQTVSMN